MPQDTKIDVMEVYCGQCRRPYDAVCEKDCEAAESKDHLIGGPTGERKKRKGGEETDDFDVMVYDVADVG